MRQHCAARHDAAQRGRADQDLHQTALLGEELGEDCCHAPDFGAQRTAGVGDENLHVSLALCKAGLQAGLELVDPREEEGGAN